MRMRKFLFEFRGYFAAFDNFLKTGGNNIMLQHNSFAVSIFVHAVKPCVYTFIQRHMCTRFGSIRGAAIFPLNFEYRISSYIHAKLLSIKLSVARLLESFQNSSLSIPNEGISVNACISSGKEFYQSHNRLPSWAFLARISSIAFSYISALLSRRYIKAGQRGGINRLAFCA